MTKKINPAKVAGFVAVALSAIALIVGIHFWGIWVLLPLVVVLQLLYLGKQQTRYSKISRLVEIYVGGFKVVQKLFSIEVLTDLGRALRSQARNLFVAFAGVFGSKNTNKILVVSAVAMLVTGLGVYFSWELIMTTPAKLTPSSAMPYPDLVPAPLGADRHLMTNDQLEWRVGKMSDTRTFWIMREDGAVKGAERIASKDYQSYIDGAAVEYKVPRELIESIHFLESFGRENAKSPTGPVGPGQIAKRTGINIGPVKDGRCLVEVKGLACGEKAPKEIPPVTKDLRTDIEMSAYGTAKLLADEYDFFGNWDFAVMAYHSSREDVRQWIKRYLAPQASGLGGKADAQKYHVTFEKMFFDMHPYHNPGTYRMYRELMDQDWGPHYAWKVRCSAKLLELYRSDKEAFVKLAAANKHEGKRAKYRMGTFYDENCKAIKDLNDLQRRIESGDLVTLPKDPDKFGYRLRIGAGGIGEMDLPNASSYAATKPEVAGLLLWVSMNFKQMRKDHNQPGFVLDVSSVSRTIDYQKRLTKINGAATKELSFHVLGSAFDIAKTRLNAQQQMDLRFVLDELDSIGFISWIPENLAYHVVVAPDPVAKEFFIRFYNDHKEFHQTSPLVTAE
ncbi:MAG: DUF5715 family protein [Candidatus Doudnabacteria bacterium]